VVLGDVDKFLPELISQVELLQKLAAENLFKSEEKGLLAFLAPGSFQNPQEGLFQVGAENAKDSALKDEKGFYHYYGSQAHTPAQLLMGFNYKQMFSTMASVRSGLSDLALLIAVELDGALSEYMAIDLASPLVGSQQSLLRTLYYPKTELGKVTAAAHEDINWLTLLPCAGVTSGLEINVDSIGSRWVDVSGKKGDVVINVGDMLQEYTQGTLKSTTHRVVSRGEERTSVALFSHPRPEVVLSERYTAGSYLKERLEQIGIYSNKQEEKYENQG